MAVEAASHASLELTPTTTSSSISPSTTSSSISPSTTSSSIPPTTEPSHTGSDSTPPTTSGTSSDDTLPVTTSPGPYLTAVGALTSTTYTHTLPIPAHNPYMHTPSTATHTPIEPRVKLPKIDLTKFDGDFTKWTTFWDVFESSVHMNSTLSKVDKFIYLRSLLEFTAVDAISGLSLSSTKLSLFSENDLVTRS